MNDLTFLRAIVASSKKSFATAERFFNMIGLSVFRFNEKQ